MADDSSSVRLRPYEAADAKPLADLFFAAVRDGTVGYYSEEERRAWAPSPPDTDAWHARLDGQVSWVAEDASGLLGFMTLRDDGYIDLAYVRPDQRGQGIADLLYQRLEALARQRGLERLTSDASHLARRFFERRGWQVIATREQERKGVILVNHQMAKTLP